MLDFFFKWLYNYGVVVNFGVVQIYYGDLNYV